jgi:hypothetical protein
MVHLGYRHDVEVVREPSALPTLHITGCLQGVRYPSSQPIGPILAIQTHSGSHSEARFENVSLSESEYMLRTPTHRFLKRLNWARAMLLANHCRNLNFQIEVATVTHLASRGMTI